MRYFVQGWLKQDIESSTVSRFAFTEQFSSDAMTYIFHVQELTSEEVLPILDALLQGVLYD